MKKPNKNKEYVCPHGEGSRLKGGLLQKVSYVTGSFCKNNCGKYMKDCKKWKKE